MLRACVTPAGGGAQWLARGLLEARRLRVVAVEWPGPSGLPIAKGTGGEISGRGGGGGELVLRQSMSPARGLAAFPGRR